MTVPSAIGIISSYFVASERVVALTFFGASGAIGFCAGLLFGGFVTEALGWRYIFRIAVVATGPLGLIGCFYLPKDRREGSSKPSLDFLGAGLSTSGLILLSFVLSSGGEYGWNKAFIIVLLVAILVVYAVTRGADGVLHLTDLQLYSPSLRLSGQGRRNRDGTFHIEARGRQAKYGPVRMTLERSIAYVADDELVEVTPKAVRLRKRYLDANDRKRMARQKEVA